ARRARALRATLDGVARRKGLVLRRGRVGQGGLRRDRAALRRGAGGEPGGRRRSRDGQRRPLRRRLADPHPARRSLGGRRAARRRGVPASPGPAVTHPYLALTDDDREEMLRTIGVASVDELFRDLPGGVRLGRELDLEPALSEQELAAHL